MADERSHAGRIVESLLAADLGLDHAALGFGRTTGAWIEGGAAVQAWVTSILGDLAEAVAHIGSSSVPGLLAKTVVDLAVGNRDDDDLAAIAERLAAAGWIHRGDAGDHGGQVFVLEARPGHRVAHLHVVAHGGRQWREYLRFRDHLRASADARRRYEAVKRQLAADLGDRLAYQDGKAAVVAALLAEAAR